MTKNSDILEIESPVCALIFRAIRDSEKRSKTSIISYSDVQNVLSYYKDACVGQKDISSLVVDIDRAKSVLTQFKASDYSIMQVKKITEDAIEPSQKKLIEEQIR